MTQFVDSNDKKLVKGYRSENYYENDDEFDESVVEKENLDNAPVVGPSAPIGSSHKESAGRRRSSKIVAILEDESDDSESSRRSKKSRREDDHITIWRKSDGVKVSGNSAPYARNIAAYLATHPDCEIYAGQTSDNKLPENWRMDTKSGRRLRLVNGRRRLREKDGIVRSGNCCPIFRNTERFLKKKPQYKLIPFQDDRAQYDAEQFPSELLTSVCDNMAFGPGRHHRLFEFPLTYADEYHTERRSFDESHLRPPRKHS